MKLEYDREQLLDLMKDFFISTGMRIVLFDDEYRILLAYPEHDCTFCRAMKSVPASARLCRQSDEHSFQTCAATRKLSLYHCHAGLIEATLPLVDSGIIIGYLMFGQISDKESGSELADGLTAYADGFRIEPGNCSFDDIPHKSLDEIKAASKIMEALTFYALYHKTISLHSQVFTERIRKYLLAHINEPLSPESIAKAMNCSRSKLYMECERNLGTGIMDYLSHLRMEEARRLLTTTDLPVSKVAEAVGFTDYNYFCRIFKKENGLPAKTYRQRYGSSE